MAHMSVLLTGICCCSVVPYSLQVREYHKLAVGSVELSNLLMIAIRFPRSRCEYAAAKIGACDDVIVLLSAFVSSRDRDHVLCAADPESDIIQIPMIEQIEWGTYATAAYPVSRHLSFGVVICACFVPRSGEA